MRLGLEWRADCAVLSTEALHYTQWGMFGGHAKRAGAGQPARDRGQWAGNAGECPGRGPGRGVKRARDRGGRSIQGADWRGNSQRPRPAHSVGKCPGFPIPFSGNDMGRTMIETAQP